MSWRCLETEHKVRIRRQRLCEWCGRTWPVGSKLWTWTGKDDLDHTVTRIYMCQVCLAYAHERCRHDDELPCEPFWFDDPKGYAEIEKRMSLVVVVMQAGLDFILPLHGMSDDRRAKLLRKGRIS